MCVYGRIIGKGYVGQKLYFILDNMFFSVKN